MDEFCYGKFLLSPDYTVKRGWWGWAVLADLGGKSAVAASSC